MADAIQWMGAHFTPEQYLRWTRIECAAWTLADFVLVFYLLRMANLARRVTRAHPRRLSFAILWATALPAVCIPFAPTGARIFGLELAVTVPHFYLILDVLVRDARHAARALAEILDQAG